MWVLLGLRLERCLSLWNKEGLASSLYHQHHYCYCNKSQAACNKGWTPGSRPVKPQSNCNKSREMQKGTKLSHLQKCRRGFEQRTSETTSTIWCTAEVPFPRLRYKASPGTKSSVHQKLSGTTKPAHPNILWCAWPMCRTDMLEKRVGEENGTTKWKIWTWLLPWLRARLKSLMKERIIGTSINMRCSSSKIL